MSYKIIESFSETTLIDFTNSTDSLYIKDLNIHLKHFSGYDDYTITDVTNALKTGAVCNRYAIRSNAPHGNLVITNWLLSNFGNDMNKIVNCIKAYEFIPEQGYYKDITITMDDYVISITKTELKSINTYSPFNHANIKPLTEIPKKWIMKHAVKAILNNQFDNLYCNGVLTDDYAYDAASNFRQGTIKNPIAFIKSIIESPSGWWTTLDGNSVKLCCHSFDSNSFTLKIGQGEG